MSIKYFYLLLLAGIWLFMLTMDAASLILLTRGADEKIRLWEAYKIATIRTFFNVITPFSVGGQPLMVYTLKKEGIPVGKGSSIVVMKLMIMAAFKQLGGIVTFVFFHRYISNIPNLNRTFFITGILFVIIFCALVVLLLNPRLLIPFIVKVGSLLHRLKLLKEVNVFQKKVVQEVGHARKIFKQFFGHHVDFFIGGILTSGLMYFAQVVMLWVTLQGLGVQLSFIEGVTLGTLIIFLLSFMPTPGSAGLGEAIFVIILAGTVPKYLLGIAVILWRTFYHYLTAFCGSIFSVKYLSNILVVDSDNENYQRRIAKEPEK